MPSQNLRFRLHLFNCHIFSFTLHYYDGTLDLLITVGPHYRILELELYNTHLYIRELYHFLRTVLFHLFNVVIALF